jgi:hypothetical protein
LHHEHGCRNRRCHKKVAAGKIWQVGNWFDEYREGLWDKQMDADIAAGKLDKLWEKAKADIGAGRVKPLGEVLNDE